MYLLDTSTITLSEYSNNILVNYAILSHRWDESEVSFQEMRDGTAIHKPGYAKIQRCCAQALEDGWKYVWIDSCCIDKTSSAELSEAINSMFTWYKDAQVCYAYLGDVPSTRQSLYVADSAFRESQWFRRGWTLQELLAPQTVVFFDQSWVDMGTKSSLNTVISDITGIQNLASFELASVAQKMSWAAHRQTTRVEDEAYCLMGLFGVNMPLLYGEGERAFLRLQHEILKITDDESIFAWGKRRAEGEDLLKLGLSTDQSVRRRQYSGLLAQSALNFEHSGDVKRVLYDGDRPPYSVTNKGLQIEPLLIRARFGPLKVMESSDLYLMPLNCGRYGKNGYLSIYLHDNEGTTMRIWPSELVLFEITAKDQQKFRAKRTILFVKQPEQSVRSMSLLNILRQNFVTLQVDTRFLSEYGVSILQQLVHTDPKSGYWRDFSTDKSQLTLCFARLAYCHAELRFANDHTDLFSILFERDSSSVSVDIVVPYGAQHLDQVVARIVSTPRPYEGQDRISKRLQSGESVSVAVKKKDAKNYRAEITLDPEGYLPWPSPDSV